jgi:hypothetical protein
LDDGVYDNEDCNQDPIDEVDIVDIRGLTTMDEDNCFDNVDVLEGPFTPMDQTLARLHETLVEITTKCTVGVIIELCDHTISLLQRVASNIHHLHLAQVNESMHLEWYFAEWMMALGTLSIG